MRSIDSPTLTKPTVLVIGAAGMDIIGSTNKPIQNSSSSPSTIRISFGGVARNVAENLARLGMDVNLLTVVGNDFYGQELLKRIKAVGIDTSACYILQKQRTGTYMAVLAPQDHVLLAMDDMEILKNLNPEMVYQHANLINQASLVYLDANLAPITIDAIFQLANHANVPVCVDPTSSMLAHRVIPYLNQVMLVNPNAREASILCDNNIEIIDPHTALQAARCLVNKGVKIALVSMAEIGVCYATPETSGYIPAIKSKIIDPTGVGDALSAATIFGLLNEIPLDESIRLGVSAATLTLKHRGSVFPGLSLDKLYNQLVI